MPVAAYDLSTPKIRATLVLLGPRVAVANASRATIQAVVDGKRLVL